MRETLLKLSPVPQPTILQTLTINGKLVYQANALEIVFQKDAFDRRRVLDRDDHDPKPEFIFKVANGFLAKLRSITQGSDVKLLGEQNALWRLEYLTDAQEELPHDPELFRETSGFGIHGSLTVVNKVFLTMNVGTTYPIFDTLPGTQVI